MAYSENIDLNSILEHSKNDLGLIRVSSVRESFRKVGLSVEDVLRMVPGAYLEWVGEDEYLVIAGIFKHGKITDYKTVGVLASKRGNDVYNRRLMRRLGSLIQRSKSPLRNIHVPRGKHFKVNTLAVTLTFERGAPLADCWLGMPINHSKSTLERYPFWDGDKGKRYRLSGDKRVYLEYRESYLNPFYSALRKRYGKISVFRVLEAHEDGYPHYHLIVYFHDYYFDGFSYFSKHSHKEQIRINPHGVFNRLWNHGFVDVQGVDDISGGIRYASKYLLDGVKIDKKHGLYTMALSWFYNRKLWSISGDFLDLMSSCVSQTQPYKGYIIPNFRGENLGWEWHFVGIFPEWFIGRDGIDKEKPPPPQLIRYMNQKKELKAGYPISLSAVVSDLSEEYGLSPEQGVLG